MRAPHGIGSDMPGAEEGKRVKKGLLSRRGLVQMETVPATLGILLKGAYPFLEHGESHKKRISKHGRNTRIV